MEKNRVLVSALSYSHDMIYRKPLTLSEPQFLHLENGQLHLPRRVVVRNKWVSS